MDVFLTWFAKETPGSADEYCKSRRTAASVVRKVREGDGEYHSWIGMRISTLRSWYSSPFGLGESCCSKWGNLKHIRILFISEGDESENGARNWPVNWFRTLGVWAYITEYNSCSFMLKGDRGGDSEISTSCLLYTSLWRYSRHPTEERPVGPLEEYILIAPTTGCDIPLADRNVVS